MGQDQGRVAIIGAGHVGATTAYALMLRALFREIILIDNDAVLAAAEAADIADAGGLARPAIVRAGGYQDAASARIVILTAGAATHGDESRLSVAGRSADIVRSCVGQLMAAGFDGIILVAANPVDVMTMVAQQESALPHARVIGTGTLLDSNRLRALLARQLAIAPASIDAMILGEHGDTSFAALSIATVGGTPIARFAADAGPIAPESLNQQVRQAAYRIIEGKGHTSFGIGTAIVRICEAIVRNEHVILPVSAHLTGQFGIDDLYLSLPCILGAGGVERVLTPDLDGAEIAAFRQSAAAVGAALKTVGKGTK
ncbi:L-lactate dehydrogenase [Sphingobium sp. MK2]|uniref:L-lactate dehydrogenase n=1 Tax=Sphingobium sp. MK2 TaxID=3116540 RepID=UPI0032E36500